MNDADRPGKPALVETTWQVHVILPREFRRMDTGLTHGQAADLMKLCRNLFPKSVIICSMDKADQHG